MKSLIRSQIAGSMSSGYSLGTLRLPPFMTHTIKPFYRFQRFLFEELNGRNPRFFSVTLLLPRQKTWLEINKLSNLLFSSTQLLFSEIIKHFSSCSCNSSAYYFVSEIKLRSLIKNTIYDFQTTFHVLHIFQSVNSLIPN